MVSAKTPSHIGHDNMLIRVGESSGMGSVKTPSHIGHDNILIRVAETMD